MDTRSNSNPFDDVEPHCHLPPEARAALWAASELVLTRPGDFADAVGWLEDRYSEEAVLVRRLRDSDQLRRTQLRALVKGVDPCDTFPRRKLMRAGRRDLSPDRRLELLRELALSRRFAHKLIARPEWVRELMVRLTVRIARSRGRRLDGNQLATRNASNEKNVVDAGNVEVVWNWLDEQSRRRVREIRSDHREREEEHRERSKDRRERLQLAVQDVLEAGLPAGKSERTHACRVVLLASLLSYQHELKLPGEFSAWAWESSGNVLGPSFGGHYVPGRESVLFDPFSEPDDPTGPCASDINVKQFVGLAERAVRVLRQRLAATPPERVETIDAEEASPQAGDAGRRRGRLPREEAEAKRSHVLALIRQHDTLRFEPARLAQLTGVSESTVRRWLLEEEEKYRESKAANTEPRDE